MYVLARREGDSIVIADLIEVKVLSVNGKIVRLGVSAPREIGVERRDKASPDSRQETQKC
jgi:carbon storage regulator